MPIMKMTTRSGLQSKRGVTSKSISSRSSSQSKHGAASSSMPSSSGLHGELPLTRPSSSSRPIPSQSGLQQHSASSAAEHYGASSAAAGGEPISSSTASGSASMREARDSPKGKYFPNPWNRFQHENLRTGEKACLKRQWPKFSNMKRRSTTRATKP